MSTTNTTPNRAYQEPFGTNDLATDVGRIVSALRAIDADVADAFGQLASKAGLASPAFTGAPTVPTQAPGDDSNKIANTAFVRAALAALVGMAPDALDTIEELAAKAEDNSDLIDLLEAAVAAKADAAATTAALAGKADAATAATLTGTQTLTNKTLTAPVINAPSGEFIRGYLTGLTLSNNTTDATNDIDIAPGSAGSDGAAPVLMTLSSVLTKRLDAAWAAGSGNGGLDTGSIANTTYHVWLIQRSDTGVVDALFSASATSPTMPTNYDRKAYIAPIVRASGAILPFTQVSRDTFVMGQAYLSPTESVSTSAALHTLSNCPVGVNVLAEFSATAFSASANIQVWLSSPLMADETTSAGTRSSISVPGNIAWASGQFRLVTNTSGQVRKKSSAAITNFVTAFTGFTLLRQ